MATKEILGHINCPHCDEPNGMAVHHDKNGHPFGFCEYCSGQLRIGGNPGRVRSFIRRFPWAAGGPDPVTVTDTGAAAPVTVTGEPAPVTVTVTEEKPAKRKATFADALLALGVAQ